MSVLVASTTNPMDVSARRSAHRLTAIQVALVLMATGWMDVACAQTLEGSSAVYQSSDGQTPSVRPFVANPKRHLTFANKPCLTVTGAARPEANNPRIFQHVLTFENKCGQAIKVKACYIASDRCVIETVFGYKTVEDTLGIVANVSRFEFKFNERF